MEPGPLPDSRAERATSKTSVWLRTDRVCLVLLLLVLGASLPFLVHPWYDATGDGTMYLLTAQSLADGNGYSALIKICSDSTSLATWPVPQRCVECVCVRPAYRVRPHRA